MEVKIFNLVIRLVKRVNRQMLFTCTTNKKATGLVNHIVIWDLYTLIVVMFKRYPFVHKEMVYNDENKKVRLAQISFILASVWRVSMICKNIFLMDVPFRIVDCLINMEDIMSNRKVDVNKEVRVNIIKDILTMVLGTNTILMIVSMLL